MLIETRHLTKTFGDIQAVNDLTVQLPAGAIGLLGPNGAGKTTLLRLLLGLLRPTTGSGRVFGMDVQGEGLRIRERVGYMPEHDCLLPEMTGVGFVAYMGRISGLDKDTALSRAHDVLHFVGLREERYRKVGEYSTGMRQRIKLAQALVHDPPLYVFDEPTAGLDPGGREEMLGLLQTIARSKDKSLVLSTHLLPDVEAVCEHVLILNEGTALSQGGLREMLTGDGSQLIVRVKGDAASFAKSLEETGLSTAVRGVEVRVQRKPEVERILFEVAAKTGVQIRYLGREMRSLEEVFLSLVNAGPEVPA